MSLKITYFVHWTTTDNEQWLATWRSQGVLSEIWIQQSKELWWLVKNKVFDIIFCSDLQRAIDSANLWFWNKYKVIQDKRIRECNYGDFNEKPGKEFKSNMKDNINIPFTNGESYKDVENRIKDFLDFAKKEYNGKHIAIVAHQWPQLALDVILKWKTRDTAIDEDWRKRKMRKPGWEYTIN